jgi:hypothetical protein
MPARNPREVFKQPDQWKFESVNYRLDQTLYSQVPPSAKERFVAGLLNGFSTTIVKALNGAERSYRDTASAFDLKNCLGINRS